MSKVLLLWAIALAVGLAVYLWLPNDKADSRLPKWRVVVAGTIFALVVGTVTLTTVDADYHVCKVTTLEKSGGELATPSTETTRTCGPPVDLALAGLLLLPSLGLLTPAFSELSFAGLGAKFRDLVVRQATEQAAKTVVTHEIGSSFASVLQGFRSGSGVSDLPDES